MKCYGGLTWLDRNRSYHRHSYPDTYKPGLWCEVLRRSNLTRSQPLELVLFPNVFQTTNGPSSARMYVFLARLNMLDVSLSAARLLLAVKFRSLISFKKIKITININNGVVCLPVMFVLIHTLHTFINLHTYIYKHTLINLHTYIYKHI